MKKSVCKKAAAILLATSMAAAMMAGCSGSSGSSESATTEAAKAAETVDGAGQEAAEETIDYPTDAIQVIVPVSAGGDTDANARLLAQYMEPELGVSMPIVNVSGSSGTIGMEQVRTSEPDGYTCLFFHAEAMIPEITGLIDYQLDEFKMAGVCLQANTTLLVTHNDSGFTTLDEFLSAAKEAPGTIEFGMATGGYPNLIGVALEETAGIDLNLVDIGGNADKIAALAGHNTDVINVEYALVKDYLETGEFIALAVLNEERNPLFDEIPTAKEQGLDMVFGKFFFVAFPKDTPDAIVDQFSAAMEKAVANEGFIEQAETSYALTCVYMDPEEATAYAQSQYELLNTYRDLLRAQ
ncbi:MAG: tripartite tricarboxylate transporter substrate binding protein [Clostridiales bacterium]|nr:tripartite tricarboxylate transporter substrate binding protein [Clostridiales bacterium]